MTRLAGVLAATAVVVAVSPARAAEDQANLRPYALVHVRVGLPFTQVSLTRPFLGGENRVFGGAAILGYQHGRAIAEGALGSGSRRRDLALRAGAIPWRWDSRSADEDGAPRGWLVQLELLAGYRQMASQYSPARDRFNTLAALDLISYAGGDGVGLSTRLAAGVTYAPEDVPIYKVLLDLGITFGVVF